MTGPREVTDDGVLQQLHEKGEGLLYNDFSGHGATGHLYNVLHAARRPWAPLSDTNVRKFFSVSSPRPHYCWRKSEIA